MATSQEPGTATAPETIGEANRFTITGPIVISYSRTSIDGVPQFSYKDGERDLNVSGDDITRVDTDLGEIVTVTLEDLTIVDGPRRTFTLLVPEIRLSMDSEVPFDTVGIETINSAIFQTPVSGVLQTYRSHQLRGTAALVHF